MKHAALGRGWPEGYEVPEYWRTWQLLKLTGRTVDEIEEAPGGAGIPVT